MEIKDSGQRRTFETGAVRDIAEGKGRCDIGRWGAHTPHHILVYEIARRFQNDESVDF